MTSLTSDVPDLGAADTSKWWIPVVLGALSILVGFLALIWPGATLLVTGIMFGILLIFVGGGNLAFAFSGERSTGWRIAGGILGVLTVFVGIVLLFRPGASVLTAAWVLGFWFLVTGVVQFIQGIAHHESRWWNLIFGVIGIIAGGIILGSPAIGLATLVLICGIGFMVRGVVAIALGFAIRSIGKNGGGPTAVAVAV